MNQATKQALAVVFSVAILGILVYGTYLPLKKSRAFITALNAIPSIDTIERLEAVIDVPIETYAPIGQEEVVRNIVNTLMQAMVQNSGEPEIVRRLLAIAAKRYEPIMKYGKGMSFDQNLYLLGSMHQVAFQSTGDPRYLEAALDYFTQGIARSSTRPQFLYGLLNAYVSAGDVAHARDIAERILKLWPEDERITAFLDELPAVAGSETQ